MYLVLVEIANKMGFKKKPFLWYVELLPTSAYLFLMNNFIPCLRKFVRGYSHNSKNAIFPWISNFVGELAS
jgi:hypothetical protein